MSTVRTCVEPAPAAPFRFDALVIDGDPALLEQSYRLRHAVYCHERKFLPADGYPDGLEIDGYDAHSVHVAVIDPLGQMAGTARLVKPSELGLPMLDHCGFFPGALERYVDRSGVVELSRLSVSRHYVHPDRLWMPGYDAAAAGRPSAPEQRQMFIAVFKALYQASKRMGVTHWLAATERSLQRLMGRYGIPFVAIGPEGDYFGPVAPYGLELGEFDRVILSRRYPALDEMLVGLEPEVRPSLRSI